VLKTSVCASNYKHCILCIIYIIISLPLFSICCFKISHMHLCWYCQMQHTRLWIRNSRVTCCTSAVLVLTCSTVVRNVTKILTTESLCTSQAQCAQSCLQLGFHRRPCQMSLQHSHCSLNRYSQLPGDTASLFILPLMSTFQTHNKR